MSGPQNIVENEGAAPNEGTPRAYLRTAARMGQRLKNTAIQLRRGQLAARREFPAGWGIENLDVRLQRASDLCAMVCMSHGLKIHRIGALPPARCIVVSNHCGYFDPLLLTTMAPGSNISKAEIAQWPLVGETMLRLGTLFYERGSPWSGAQVLKRAWQVLDAGYRVIGFPEGTTSIGDDILPFHRGLFGLARLAQIPIVPAVIHYHVRDMAWIDDATFVPHYLSMIGREQARIDLWWGEPVEITDEPHAEAERMRARMQDALATLRCHDEPREHLR